MAAAVPARAQLVADGETNILDGVIVNVPSLTVGTNGSFTLLVLTNGAIVTNTLEMSIGANASAQSNRVVVTRAGSLLGSPSLLGGLAVGESGSFNELRVLDGAFVGYKSSDVGLNASGKSNLVVVDGAGSFLNQAILRVGSAGSGNQLLITNGGMVKTTTGTIGQAISASNNLVIVTGPGSTWSNSTVNVGNYGTGNLLIVTNGGTVTGGADGIGTLGGSGNAAIVAGAGSVWQNSLLTMSANVGGPLNRLVITAGGAVLGVSTCTIGYYANSNSALVTGIGSRLTNGQSIVIGYAGRGNELIISNGARVTTGTTYAGQNGSSEGRLVVTGAGSLLTNHSDCYVGQLGSSNSLLVGVGGRLADNFGYIGSSAFQNGNSAVVSGGLWTNRADLYVGSGSYSSQLLVTNAGRVAVNSNSYVGYSVYSSNNLVVVSDAVDLSGGGAPPVPSLWTNRSNLYFGYSGAFNQMFVTNAGMVVNNYGYVGYNSSSVSNKILVSDTGSVWQARSPLYLGYVSKGNQLVVSNGGTVTAPILFIGNNSANASNQVVIAGGSLLVSSSLMVNFGTLTLNSGVLNATALTLSDIKQPKLAFNGGTLQTRSTTATSTPFVVGDGANAAVFEMLATGVHTFPGGLILSSNATLKGVGTIVGDVTNRNGGRISPGASLGQIAISNRLVLNPGSVTAMELNATTGTSDALVGMTNLIYGGTLQLTNISGVLTAGDSFALFSASNYFGAFDSVLPHTPGPGLRWNLDRLTVDGVLQVVAKSPSPPPVLSSVALSAGNLVIGGANGVPYDPCVLLSATNAAEPVVNWIPWKTNYFDGSGNVVFTNALPTDEPQRYFRLQVE